jgi:RNA polymerase sigma factor (sigma-70 family)
MADQVPLHHDPSIRRLQQAFAHEEPTTELPEVLRRAAHYRATEPPDTATRPAPGHDLTTADLAAARHRDPAAVTRVYTAYAPALFRFFMATVGDRQTAQDLTGGVLANAVEGLPGFRGPVEALSGWLFRIARHDLYDLRRKQAHAHSAASNADVQALLPAIQAVLDGQDPAPPATLSQPIRRLLDNGGRVTDPALHRLSPREREVLAMLGRGLGAAQIGHDLAVSPHTIRTHLQNILDELKLHLATDRLTGQLPDTTMTTDADDPEELTIQRWEASRVIAALRQLAPDQQEVLLLRMAAGLTAPEVAAALHKPTGAVKALQHRALARLAVVMGLRDPDRGGAAAGLRALLRPPQPPDRPEGTPDREQEPAPRPDSAS